jgi:hypothetical protein
MWNSGKSTDRARHPEMRSYCTEGSRLWSCVPLRHESMARGAVASKVMECRDWLRTRGK